MPGAPRTVVVVFGTVLALLSALVWGCGDFAGGLATRKADQFQVLGLSALAGFVLVVLLAVGAREQVPSLTTVAWSGAAGVSGAIGIASLYRGLATGSAATVAPTAAVVTAVLPVAVTAATLGLPGTVPQIGFGLAMIGIWLTARSADGHAASAKGLPLAVLAGIGFGGFLVLIANTPSNAVFGPLAVARFVAVVTATILLAARRGAWPSPIGHPFAILAGVLDAGGNALYMAARQYVRLDVAAVLSSLYPVATVVLAWLILRERISPLQWTGAIICLIAVAMISAP